MSNITCKILRGSAAATMAIVLCGAAPANEQQTSDRNTQTSTKSDAKAQSTAQQGTTQRQRTARQDTGRAPAIVIGKLVETREVNIKGQGTHRLLKLQPRGGEDNAVIVDLGPDGESGISGLTEGDRVIAVGRPGRINERPVVVAHSVGEFRATGVPGSSSRGARKTGG